MDKDRTTILKDDDGTTHALLDFGPPDETLDETDSEPASGTSSMRSEQLRLNRRFLEDATPFELEGFGPLLESRKSRLELHQKPEWSLPAESLILLRGDRGSGKSCLLMNMMWRLSERYPGHHMVFFSFERSKPDVFMRLLLLGAQQVFPNRKGLDAHLEEWRNMVLMEDPETLKQRSSRESSLAGLAYLLQHGHRIHVVDRLGDLKDVVISLNTFASSFPMSVAFIDGGDWLLHTGDKGSAVDRLPQLLAQLRKTARALGITIVMGLSEAVPDTSGFSTLYEAVGCLDEPWGGGDGSLIMEWQEPGHSCKLEIPLLSYNQRFVWNGLREADEIE